MPAKLKSDPKQSERFKEAAKKVDADESGEAFERAFKKIVAPKKAITSRRSKESS